MSSDLVETLDNILLVVLGRGDVCGCGTLLVLESQSLKGKGKHGYLNIRKAEEIQ